ncbi:MAG: LacI family DNA-binding transcriptional regulator [Intrasporangium sp.]|uniref:LacI family DNA-binding transcriptional regulator n=1 Tax=Intrasporangium sp. TaxID=1925024 RepID=UPI003F80E608
MWSNDVVHGSAAPPTGASRPTIHDVARLAGVSIATVSRVLTGAKPVSTELGERVKAATDSLGYRPNPAARVLLSGRAHTIGIVVPDLANPYFGEILKGATPAAAQEGWQTLVADSDEDPEEEYRCAMELARRVDGLILCAPRMMASRIAEVARAVPALVLINRSVRGKSADSVLVDYDLGMTELVDHLVSLGHRRVAYLSGPAHAWSDRQRRRVLERARRAGLDVVALPCGSTVSDGHRMAEAALDSRPTAVIAFNDNVALGLLSRLHELGVRVPEDVSVTGFDDIPLGGLTPPGLTTVGVPKQALGRLAWQRLSADRGQEPQTVSTKVPVELVVRGTTGPPPGTA